MTIIASSHILAELEDYSTEMLVIHEGLMLEHRLLKANTTVSNFVNIEIGFTEFNDKWAEQISAIDGVVEVEKYKNKLHVKLDVKKLSKENLLKRLIAQDIMVEGFAEVKVNLQDEYIKTVSNYKQTKEK